MTRRQTSSSVSIGTILTSDPCLPSTYQTASAEASRSSAASANRISPESFWSWLHKTWDRIRNAIKNINIKIAIPWNVLEDWINKVADGWTVQQDPSDSQTVDVIPSAAAAKAGAQAYKWKAPVMVSRPPVEECGFATAPGKPVKACP